MSEIGSPIQQPNLVKIDQVLSAQGGGYLGRFAAGVGFTLAGKLAGRGIHVIGQVVLARLLGLEGYGLYAIGWTLLRVVGLVAPFGMDHGVIRYGTRFWKTNARALRGTLLQSIGLSFLAGLSIGAGFYIFAPWLANDLFGKPELLDVIRLFSLTFPLWPMLKVSAAATRISQKMQYSVLSQELLQPAVHLVAITIVLGMGYGLHEVIGVAVLSFLIALLVSLWFVRKLFPEAFGRQDAEFLPLREWMSFSVPASLAVAFSMFLLWVDRFIVAFFRSIAEVGLYQAASQVVILFPVIVSGFATVFSPMIVDLWRRKENKRLQELYGVGTKWVMYFSLPLFLVILLEPHILLGTVYGESYSLAGSALRILAFGQIISAAVGPVGMLLVMTGHQRRLLAISGSAFILNVILNVMLVPRWGIVGAATGTAVSIGVLYIGALLNVWWILGLWPYDRRYWKSAVAALTAGAGIVFVLWLPINSDVLRLLISLMISVGGFMGALYLLGLDVEDEQLVSYVSDFLRSLKLRGSTGT